MASDPVDDDQTVPGGPHGAQRAAIAADDTIRQESTRPIPAEASPGPRIRISRPKHDPTRLGRYAIVKLLGSGGMGSVYEAHDGELGRSVAIKVLREDREAEELTEGLRREAQALAKLVHPNVVTVYDVGVDQGQLFVVMQLIDGESIDTWLRGRDASPATIVAAFRDAGRGLAAAHAANLVHCDFKPANVLVDRDGVVRVGDFGLARIGADGPTSVAGTPRYMAPEQFAGVATAASDQYAFCVALWEVLAGDPPFPDTPLDSGEAARARTPPELPRSAAVPAYVVRALLRGLSQEPADRFPSMDALLDALAPPRSRVRMLGFTALSLAAIATGIVVTAVHERAAAPPDPCAAAGDPIAEVWTPARRMVLARRFAETNAPYAAAAIASAGRALDAYAADWHRSAVDACRATHVRHEVSPELLDLRAACLERRRSAIAALVDVLATADAQVVAHAAEATAGLPAIADCDDLTALQAPVRPPSDVHTRGAVDELRERESRVEAQFLAGRYGAALGPAESLARDAEALGYAPLEAETKTLLGTMQNRTGHFADAGHSLVAAFAAAIVGHDDAAAAKAAALVLIAKAGTAEIASGEEWSQLAEAAVARLGNPPLPLATELAAQGYLEATAGKHDAAVALHERARALRERFEPDSLDLGKSYQNLAYNLDELGKFTEARAAGERALHLEEAILGPDHPEIAMVLTTLGNIASDQGLPDSARDYYTRALAIRERSIATGDDPGGRADLLNNLGILASQKKDYETADSLFQRAIDIRAASDPSDPEMTLPMVSMAVNSIRRGRCAEALPELRRALSIVEKRLGADHPYASDALLSLSHCLRLDGHLAEADAAASRALAIRQAGGRPDELAEAQFELARVQWEEGKQRAALEHAREADKIYANAHDASDLAEVEAWVRAHQGM